MKLNIAQKLMIITMVTTIIVVALIFGLTRFSILTGFSKYLEKAELSTLQMLAYDLEKKYAEKKNWNFLRGNSDEIWWLIGHSELAHLSRGANMPLPPNVLFEVHQPIAGGIPEFEAGPPPDGGADIPPPPVDAQGKPVGVPQISVSPKRLVLPIPPSPPAPGSTGAHPQAMPLHRVAFFRRVGIFDEHGDLLWGDPHAEASQLELPLQAMGKKVGYLKLDPVEQISKDLERDFVKEQSQNLLLVSAVAFLVAALAAFGLSRDLVNAIHKLVQGTRRLIAGDFATRIGLKRSDELGQLADDFNSLAATLHQQDMAKKQWITDTSHELRTPIAVLRAQIEALQDGVQQSNTKTLGVLHGEVIMLGKLVEDLHDLAKSDMGQLRYDFVPVDVGAIIQDVIEAFTERFTSKGISVDAGSIADLRCVIEADSTRLKQLFSNLFENSLRYTNSGGQFRISAEQQPGELIIYVDDSEPSVSDSSIGMIFDRFYRTESSRSRVYGGAGLGLPICKAITEAHGGKMTAGKSELGGLRVAVYLPIKEPKK